MDKFVGEWEMKIMASMFFFLMVFAFLGTAFVFAQEKTPPTPQPPSIKVWTDRPDALYEKGEAIKFNVTLTENGKVFMGQKMKYTLICDGMDTKYGSVETTEEPSIIEGRMDSPGFALLNVYCNFINGKGASGLCGAGVEPLKIKAVVKEPDDFDKFWDDQKAELAKVPMNPKLEPVDLPSSEKGKVECFDIKVDCTGGMPVSGYFSRPLNAEKGSLPIIITYHGAGVQSSFKTYNYASQGMLALDLNAHGIENGKPAEFYKELSEGKLRDYICLNINDREKAYVRGMVLRIIRSLEFMKAQPEWNGKTLVVSGVSQGGGQALIAAGVDSQVTLCVADVPALCDHCGLFENQQSGWPGFIKIKDGKLNPDVIRTVPYFDAALFAKKIKAETIVSVGFLDNLCPPTSVYAAYNNISSKKEILNNPAYGHVVPQKIGDYEYKKITEHIARMKAEK